MGWTQIRILIACALALAPCGFGEMPKDPGELMVQVLAALESRDLERLNVLAITADEFKKYVWPSLLQTRETGGQIDPDAFYGEYHKQSDTGLSELLRKYGGRRVRIHRIATFAVYPAPADNLELRSGPNVFIRDERGHDEMIQLAGGMLRRDGFWKITTYYVRPEFRIQRH